MPLSKEQKQKIVENIKDKVTKQKTMVFVDFKGLQVKEFFALRKKLKQAESTLLVAKKTLMTLVFKEKGIQCGQEAFQGQPAIIFGFKDELLPIKYAYKFSREHKNLKILGGYFENEFKGQEEMIALAQIPSKEELLARLTGSISAPISNFVSVLQGNNKGLIYTLKQIKV